MTKPNDTVTIEFTTQNPSTGAVTDATGTPSGSVYKNGILDGAVSVTVTNITTGLYKASFTVPNTYVAGDFVECVISATVSGVAGIGLIFRTQLDSKRVGDLNDLSESGTRSAVGLASANLDTQLSNIDTKTTNLPSDPASTTDVTDAQTSIEQRIDDSSIIAGVL